MSTVLLINPSYHTTYGGTKGTMTNPIYPTLGLTTIAAEALRRGHRVHILDQSYHPYDWRRVQTEILRIKPDIVGITASTPLMNQARDISVLCKDISQDILVCAGGAHPSALPVESLRESYFDLVFVGESETAFGEICDGRAPKDVLGVYFRDGDEIRFSGARMLLANLDDLPMPAWHLYNPEEYRNRGSRILVRNPPATITEFSRGCVYKCDFCASKMTMGLGYRKKSAPRCAAEVKEMHRQGWREFMLADDIFTSDNQWAGEVADAIAHLGSGMTWSCNNGIRVESANDALFRRLRASGCYRVSFGFESGSDEVLKSFGKGGRASLEKGRVAAKMARAAGIDTNGFFLLGLSADDEASMRETIGFARTLELDVMLFGIAIAFPGTQMFNAYYDTGLVRSFDWDLYHARSAEPLFAHPVLSHDAIQQQMAIAYRETILTNPAFLKRRLKRSIRTHEVLSDLRYALKMFMLPAAQRDATSAYYAQSRWPRWNPATHPIKATTYQSKVDRAPILGRY